VVVDDARGGVGIGGHDAVAMVLADAQLLGRVVVERQRDLGAVGQVRGDVVGGQLHLAVLDVLRVGEQDVVEQAELLQQGGTDEPVEVASGDESVLAAGYQRRGNGHNTLFVS